MTSPDRAHEHFIDFHAHYQNARSDIFIVYAYSPGINLKPSNTPFSCGVHPWRLNKDFGEIETLAHSKDCLFIGESGLDRAIETDIQIQLEVFKKHILLSEKLKKPLVIHCVRAFDLLFKLHSELKPKQKWIIHDFNASKEIIKECKSRSIYISLGPRHLNTSRNSKLIQNIEYIDINFVFFESDDEKLDIKDLYRFFASKFSIECEQLKKIVGNNFKNLLAHPDV